MRIQASALAMVFSKSLASLRQRPSQAKVRSTTHRRGRSSKPLARSERLMIWRVHWPILASSAPAVCRRHSRHRRRRGAARDSDGGSRPGHRRPRRDPGYRRRGRRARPDRPSVSVTMWRLRPLIFLPASKPRIPPLSVVLTLWLSMTPAVGLASRPSSSRAAMTRWWLIVSSSPRSRQVVESSAGPSCRAESPSAAATTRSRSTPDRGSRSRPREGPSSGDDPAASARAGMAKSAPIPDRSDHLNSAALGAHNRAGRFQSRPSWSPSSLAT